MDWKLHWIVIPLYYKNGTNDICQPKKMRTIQEIIKEEIMAKLAAHHERMMARMDSQLKKMEACLGKMEAMDLEANPEEKEAMVYQHQEVLNEVAILETTGALEDQYVGQHLAVGHHRQSKKQTQGDGVSRQKLAAVKDS
jgi:hypothetical protein